jgi:CRP/FNR family transcriptional regulator
MTAAPLVPLGRLPVFSDLCPVRGAGVHLRSQCETCAGVPPSGQLQIPRRMPLYGEGEPARHVYAVVRGYVRETRVTSDGRLLAVRLAAPGDLVGTESMVGGDYQSGVEAVTDAVVCRVPIDTVRDALSSDPAHALAFAELLCRQAAGLRESVVLLGSMSAEERVLSILRQLAPAGVEDDWFVLPLTRQEIGDLLGLALATVSRTVQRLHREGVLDVRGRRIRILQGRGRSAV